MEQAAQDRLRKSELHPETDESKTPRPPLTVAEKAGIGPWKKESRPTTAFEKAGIERMRKGSCIEYNGGKKAETEVVAEGDVMKQTPSGRDQELRTREKTDRLSQPRKLHP